MLLLASDHVFCPFIIRHRNYDFYHYFGVFAIFGGMSARPCIFKVQYPVKKDVHARRVGLQRDHREGGGQKLPKIARQDVNGWPLFFFASFYDVND